MKKILLLLVVMSHCVIVCGQNINVTNSLPIDTSVIAIMPSTYITVFFKNSKPSVLTAKDCKIIENLLNMCVEKHNEQWKKRGYKELYKGQFIIDLKKSKRQYLVVTNDKGEKEVYINCFNSQFKNDEVAEWRTEFITVMGGGPNFFRVKINLSSKTYYDFSVNGDE